MNNMNKKGALITLGIIIAISVLVGFIYISDKLGKTQIIVNYIGDSSMGVVYNIRSNNPNCDIDNIIINESNIEFFDEVPEGYTTDNNCD